MQMVPGDEPPAGATAASGTKQPPDGAIRVQLTGDGTEKPVLSLEKCERSHTLFIDDFEIKCNGMVARTNLMGHLLLNPLFWLRSLLEHPLCRSFCWQRRWFHQHSNGEVDYEEVRAAVSTSICTTLIFMALDATWQLFLLLLLTVIPTTFTSCLSCLMLDPDTWIGGEIIFADGGTEDTHSYTIFTGGAIYKWITKNKWITVDGYVREEYVDPFSLYVNILYMAALWIVARSFVSSLVRICEFAFIVTKFHKIRERFQVIFEGEYVDLRDAIAKLLATFDFDVPPADDRFLVAAFRTKDPVLSALGLAHFMNVPDALMYAGMAEGVPAIEREICAAGDAEDIECLEYVLREAAGSSAKEFSNGVRDAGRNGERLEDFVNHPSAQMAQLSTAHVLALRLYTTQVFRLLNGPFRSGSAEPHPCPVTMGFVNEGIRKLRAVEAAGACSNEWMDLWRGMHNLDILDEFIKEGGTESAPMSTTTDLKVAIEYALAHGKRNTKTALVLKLRTNGFLERGADLQFLSAFPAEKEICYPPLTHLRPTGRQESMTMQGVLFQVIEVTPSFSS